MFLRSYTRVFFVVITLFFPFCTASLSDTFPTRNFMSWFSEHGDYLNASSVTTCNATFKTFLEDPQSDNGVADHADCILASTTETIMANMACAGVVLGLMPIILANLGPTLAESSILALERPVLSMSLAVGGPSIYPARPFEDYDPLVAINQPPTRFRTFSFTYLSHPAASALQYVAAAAAAVNVITVSLELGMKMIVVWKKPNSFLPLTWILLPILLHVGAIIRLRLFISTALSSRQNQVPANTKRAYHTHPKLGRTLYRTLSSITNLPRLLIDIINAEIRPCRIRTKLQLPKSVRLRRWRSLSCRICLLSACRCSALPTSLSGL